MSLQTALPRLPRWSPCWTLASNCASTSMDFAGGRGGSVPGPRGGTYGRKSRSANPSRSASSHIASKRAYRSEQAVSGCMWLCVGPRIDGRTVARALVDRACAKSTSCDGNGGKGDATVSGTKMIGLSTIPRRRVGWAGAVGALDVSPATRAGSPSASYPCRDPSSLSRSVPTTDRPR